MEKLAQNIQEAFLNNARKDKVFLTIYLMSGVKLSGRIKSFDKYSVVLETNNQEQLIFKHAISTVVMGRVPHASFAGHGEAKPAAVATVPTARRLSRCPRLIRAPSDGRMRCAARSAARRSRVRARRGIGANAPSWWVWMCAREGDNRASAA